MRSDAPRTSAAREAAIWSLAFTSSSYETLERALRGAGRVRTHCDGERPSREAQGWPSAIFERGHLHVGVGHGGDDARAAAAEQEQEDGQQVGSGGAGTGIAPRPPGGGGSRAGDHRPQGRQVNS